MGVTSVRLQPEIEDELEAIADKKQRSKSWLINQALREFIAREKMSEARWKETLAALESLQVGRLVDGAEVHAWLRTWGSTDEIPAPKPRR